MRRLRALTVFAAKVAVTACLLVYVLRKVDIAPVLAQIRTVDRQWAAVALAVMSMQLVVVSWRWYLVNQLVSARMRFEQVFRLMLIGQFFNQVLPSAVGGDAVRAWLASREGVSLGRAITGVVCDRAIGLIVLVLVISCAFLVLPGIAAGRLPASELFQIIAAAGMLGLAALFFIGDGIARLLMRHRLTESVGRLVQDLRKVLYSGGTSIAVIGLASGCQLLLVLAIYASAKGMNVELDFGAALLVIPAIMLVSMIPISFAGWGVREGAMIFGLGLLGIAATQALAISVVFGLLQIIIGLPGGVLWLTRSSAARETPRSERL